MGIFSGCLLACDIDGTLVENGYINPKNVEKIEYFMREGGHFAISTGRSVTAISVVTDALKRISPSVVSNGCMIYDYENEKILCQEVLPKSDYLIVKDVLDLGLDVGIEVHTGKRIFTLRQTPKTDIHQIYEDLETTIISFEEACKYEWNKILYTGDNEADFEKLKEFSKKYNKTSHFVATAVSLKVGLQKYFEQMPKGISKASGIEKLCEMFKITNGCSYAIGDFYNDVEMLKKADISAVPIGAPDDIKKLADFIACECRDGAVADFIDYLSEKRKDGKNGRTI